MVDQLVAKRKKITAEVEKTIKTMEKVYDEAIERLSQDKEQLEQQMQLFGLNEHEAKFMRMIEDGCLSEVKGNLTSKVVQGVSLENEFTATEENVLKFWLRRKKEF
jgi:uncharacterized protein YaiL (DUF2058 family)